MSYYRDKYLKSDEWKSLRKEAIIKDGFRCRLCRVRPKRKHKKFGEGLQVHHLAYKRIHDVESSDLRTLCAECHKKVHDLMKRFPKMKTLPRREQWLSVVYHLRPELRQSLAGMVRGLNAKGKLCRQGRVSGELQINALELFSKTKRQLLADGLICKQRMKWRDSFESEQTILSNLDDPQGLIQAYIELTKQDPRRLIPVVYDPRNSMVV